MRCPLMCVFCLPVLLFSAISSRAQIDTRPTQRRSAVDSIPILFEENSGQADPGYKFLARAAGLRIAAARDGVVFALSGSTSTRFLAMRFEQQNQDAHLLSESGVNGTLNYIIGANRAGWKTRIPLFAKIRYKSLYPGVDLIFYGNGRNLEHDFVVSPANDPKLIAFQLEGADSITVTPSGDLLVKAGVSELRFRKPAAYQPSPGGRKTVAVSYQLHGSRISFALAL